GSGKQIYNVQAVTVDPSNHDILILGENFQAKKVVQRISSTGTFGARFTDTTGKLAPTSGRAARSLPVAPTGTPYTVPVDDPSGTLATRVWQLPSSLATVEDVPGANAARLKENWPLDFGGSVDQVFGGPQMAISADGSTLYWKEEILPSAEKEPGEFNI